MSAPSGHAVNSPVPRSLHDGAASYPTAIATVCLSGTLEDKLSAAAAAGFDGVEIFEPDLIASPWSPAEVRKRCDDLGLAIDLYQPFRDFDSVQPDVLRANLRRADRKFDVMEQLGTDLVLVCSSVSADAVPDDDVLAEQLATLASHAADRGVRICYEALAWGTFVNTYEHSWEIVRRVAHPALGLCVDSFHILSRGSDPSAIRGIPGDKLFFLQLADAPLMDMNVLQWSRHYRLFPGQGGFDLPAFLGHVLAAGYAGPLSLEIFNDVFRQADPKRAAVDALRSLRALAEATDQQRVAPERSPAHTSVLPPPQPLGGYAFTELAVDEGAAGHIQDALAALGFSHTGQHRSKPVQLWQQGDARVLLNLGVGQEGAAVAALGLETADPARSAQRAEALLAPVLPRTRAADEVDLSAVAAPDGTSLFFCRTGPPDAGSWLTDFATIGAADAGHGITSVDHVALTQPFDHFDEASLFYRSVLGLAIERTSEVAAPYGVVRNRAVVDPARSVRICLSVSALRRGDWRPSVADPQHVAFASADVLATVRAARAAGAPLLAIPDNYYDDLDARLELPPGLLADMRECGVLYDADANGQFLHAYTDVLGGRVFFEVVQRIGSYVGFGELNGPVRMAAHSRSRASHEMSS